MRKNTIDKNYQKTYVNTKNLEKALEKLDLPENAQYLECWTEDGRVTAVFTNLRNCDDGRYIVYVAGNGFKVMG